MGRNTTRRTAPPRGARAPAWDDIRFLQARTRIAQAAARLIAEHGITDWSAAKRKAAREVGLEQHHALPSREDIERALMEHHALFGGERHAAMLRAKRIEALKWMRRLARWSPLLVGGVAAGWAGEHSDIRLELVADDPKALEMSLASEGVSYSALPPGGEPSPDSIGAELRLDGPRVGVRLSVVSPFLRRSRPRRDDEPRLDIGALEALLEESEPAGG